MSAGSVSARDWRHLGDDRNCAGEKDIPWSASGTKRSFVCNVYITLKKWQTELHLLQLSVSSHAVNEVSTTGCLLQKPWGASEIFLFFLMLHFQQKTFFTRLNTWMTLFLFHNFFFFYSSRHIEENICFSQDRTFFLSRPDRWKKRFFLDQARKLRKRSIRKWTSRLPFRAGKKKCHQVNKDSVSLSVKLILTTKG